MFVFAPLLWIIATTEWIPAMVVAGLGALITLYHGGKAIMTHRWINVMHALIVGPAIVARGLYPSTRAFAEIVRMLAFAAFGYHLYYLVQSTKS